VRADARPSPRAQHFLRPEIARRIVARAGVDAGDLVLDLGAGTGALTLPLAAAVTAGRVVAIERDVRLARRLAARAPENVSVHARSIESAWLPRRPFRVVANLPFAGSNAIVRRLLGRGVPLLGADVVVELGVALKWISSAPARCSLGVVLPPGAFVPAPRCRAAVLVIR
jgi:23S rRNA (adenine-N6)-dimethyltransferase